MYNSRASITEAMEALNHEMKRTKRLVEKAEAAEYSPRHATTQSINEGWWDDFKDDVRYSGKSLKDQASSARNLKRNPREIARDTVNMIVGNDGANSGYYSAEYYDKDDDLRSQAFRSEAEAKDFLDRKTKNNEVHPTHGQYNKIRYDGKKGEKSGITWSAMGPKQGKLHYGKFIKPGEREDESMLEGRRERAYSYDAVMDALCNAYGDKNVVANDGEFDDFAPNSLVISLSNTPKGKDFNFAKGVVDEYHLKGMQTKCRRGGNDCYVIALKEGKEGNKTFQKLQKLKDDMTFDSNERGERRKERANIRKNDFDPIRDPKGVDRKGHRVPESFKMQEKMSGREVLARLKRLAAEQDFGSDMEDYE